MFRNFPRKRHNFIADELLTELETSFGSQLSLTHAQIVELFSLIMKEIFFVHLFSVHSILVYMQNNQY